MLEHRLDVAIRAGADGDGFIRPMLGVTGEAAGKECRIKQVFPNYPAEQAGIKTGDIIESFAGQKVGNFGDLARLVLAQEPGAKVEVELRRGEAKVQLEVVLAPRHGPLPGGPKYRELSDMIKAEELHTVCQEAGCPNGNWTVTGIQITAWFAATITVLHADTDEVLLTQDFVCETVGNTITCVPVGA